MRERTHLYSLPLRGAGSGQVQNAKSYFQHLSIKHHLTPVRMFGVLLERTGMDAGSSPWLPGFKDVNLTGTTEYSQRLLQGLEHATGVDLISASFARVAHVVAPTNLVHRFDRVCLRCIQEDADIPYVRLLWDLQFVDACPVHQVRLVRAQSLQCGSTSRRRLIAFQRPTITGVCANCGSIGIRCCRVGLEAATPEQVRLAVCAESFIASDLAPADCSPESFRAGLTRLLELRFDGSVVSAAREAKLSRGLVCSWKKGSRPGLPWLLQLCLVAGADLSSLLCGNVVLTAPLGLQSSAIKRAYRRTQIPTLDLASRIKAAAHRPSPPSLASVAKELGVHVDTLRALCPDACEELRAARAEDTKQRRERQYVTALKAFMEAGEVLKFAKGKRVTSAALQKQSGLTVYACSRSKVREQALLAVIRHFASTPDSEQKPVLANGTDQARLPQQ